MEKDSKPPTCTIAVGEADEVFRVVTRIRSKGLRDVYTEKLDFDAMGTTRWVDLVPEDFVYAIEALAEKIADLTE